MKRAPKFSQRDLDDDFEKFLKESLSDHDESFESDKLNKYFAKSRRELEKKQDSQPWWMKENEDDDDQKSPTSKWLKPKKQSTPVAVKDDLTGQDKSHHQSANNDRGSDPDFIKTRPNFSKDSLEDLTKLDRADAKSSMRRERSGVIPAQASFEDTLSYTETGTSEGLSMTPASTGPGAETLEEQADKEHFFRELEAKRGGKVDYHKLIKEADMSNTIGSVRSANLSNTMGSLPSAYMGTADEHSSPVPLKRQYVKEHSKRDETPADEPTSSQSETSPSQPTVHPAKQMVSPQRGMLANVALLETGDSMLNTIGLQEKAASKELGGGDMTPAGTKNLNLDDTGLLGAGTATEYEALQAALRDAANTPTMDFTVSGTTTNGEIHGLVSRSVHDIIREVNEEKRRMWQNANDIQSRLHDDPHQNQSLEFSPSSQKLDDDSRNSGTGLTNEERGFNLQPANQQQVPDSTLDPAYQSTDHLQLPNESRGFDLVPVNEERGFDLQPANQKQTADSILNPVNQSTNHLKLPNESRGFDLEPAIDNSRGFDLRPSSPVLPKDTHGTSADDENSQQKIPAKPPNKVALSKKPGSKTTIPRYSHIKGSGYGHRKPRSAAVWSPADAARQKVKGSEIPSVDNGSANVQGNIMASVESFAHYIKEHFVDSGKPSTQTERPIKPRQSKEEHLLSTSLQETRLDAVSRERALVAEVSEWQERWKEEHKLNMKLKAEVTAQQREAARKEEELKLNHQRELFKIQQDNFVLQAKLNLENDQQNGKKQTVSGRTIEGASQEEIKLMKKEIIEQETLLQGYQQENERLYSEVRKLQKARSDGEERLLRENQKLQTELANVKEVLEQKETALRHKGLITGSKVQQEIAAGNNTAVLGAGRIAELQVELREAQLREASLNQHLRQADDTCHELKQHIETLVRDKNHSQDKLQNLRDVTQREFQDMQLQYQRDIENLNKKLRWYAENQDLLDKNANELRDKTEEIKRLKDTLEKVNKQTNQKTSEAQRRAKDRAADAKKIQDLERQVREMNDIIRRRHPNSLPALIYAAAASGPSDPNNPAPSPAKSHTVAFLEDKVKKMEADLNEKEAETKMFARTLEQKYNVMKFQYEDRLQFLEKQLNTSKQRHQEATKTPSHPHKATPPKREEREEKLQQLTTENENLRRQITMRSKVAWADDATLTHIKESKGSGDGLNEEGLQHMLTQLAKELSNRDHEIEKLKATCQKLMEERFQTQTAEDVSAVKDKHQTGKKSKKQKSTSGSLPGEKRYAPENFTGTHISDVFIENQQLKQQLEQTALEMEQQRVSHQGSLAQSEGVVRRTQEESAERLATLRSEHAAEMKKHVTERALQHSDSRHAKLVSQIDAQQVMIRHLQEQLLDARVKTDTLAVARVREQLLQTQLEQLKGDLEEAKQAHTPEMHHFEALQAKIATMEARHSQREQELKQLVTRARYTVSYEKEQELTRYQQVLANKNKELQRFRTELDGILEVLRELQRQGVVLPLQSPNVQSLLD